MKEILFKFFFLNQFVWMKQRRRRICWSDLVCVMDGTSSPTERMHTVVCGVLSFSCFCCNYCGWIYKKRERERARRERQGERCKGEWWKKKRRGRKKIHNTHTRRWRSSYGWIWINNDDFVFESKRNNPWLEEMPDINQVRVQWEIENGKEQSDHHHHKMKVNFFFISSSNREEIFSPFFSMKRTTVEKID